MVPEFVGWPAVLYMRKFPVEDGDAGGKRNFFVFFTQVVTGTYSMFYAPSAQTAWESVYFLQYHVAVVGSRVACIITWPKR